MPVSIRRSIGYVLIAALALTLWIPSERASAATRPSVGVQFKGTWSDYTDAERAAVLDKLAAAGVEWVRIDLGWASFQETGPSSFTQWYVDRADRVVNMARERGIKVLGTLWGSPTWANATGDRSAPPAKVSDYANAARWVAAHFKGRVQAWEVWNEPNHGHFWTGTVADYVNLLRAAYPAFKEGDPGAPVVFGGVSLNDTAWLKQAYAAGAQGYFDVMATHPYMGVADAPPETPDDGTKYTLDHARAVHDLMAANGDGAKKIWFTELGWSSHANWSGIANWERGVTAQQQADYLIRTIEFTAQKHPYVERIFWYTERNEASGSVQIDNYGLMNRDLSAKPAYTSLKAYMTGGTAPAPTPDAGPSPQPSPTPESSPSAVPTPDAAPSPTATPDPLPDATPDPTPTPEPDPSPDEVVEPDPIVDDVDDVFSLPPGWNRHGRDVKPVGGGKKNLLVNGGFERGRDGWKTLRTGLSTSPRAYSGRRAGRIRGANRVLRVRSNLTSARRGQRFRGDGVVRAGRRGASLRLVIRETRHGKLVGRRAVTIRSNGRWQDVPDVRYRTKARRSRVSVRLVARGAGRAFLADDLRLRRF